VPETPLEPFIFEEVARLPGAGDNAAIALRTLLAGSRILIRQLVFEFAHTILEGHRFAVHRIRKGERLLSWGLPFGLALRDVEPGEYLCNERILRVLAARGLGTGLPKQPNFEDYRLPYSLDETRFRPGAQAVTSGPPRTFEGFRRGARGAGTRNYIIILGVNSRVGPFVRRVAAEFQNVRAEFPNIDGVAAIEHTEGGSASRPFNLDLTLRTLAGFFAHPNVAAVLVVDDGSAPLSNAALGAFLQTHRENYPADILIREFFSVGKSFSAAQRSAARKVKSWLPRVNACARESLPLEHLKIGLQCGGSDAFSGISANPLAGILSRELVARGGSANLAETDELIGAESWVLQNVRDLHTAKRFLERTDRFQKWAALHGHSAEGNPSGGNMYRGLYNITIKSIGAARKKDPATRLDYVIDFAEPMTAPGFYFMDSPGNDLESIAGQVASGCNLILFATGNGSITNFPFVPTIKVMTTTARFDLVRNEMDFNAGRYLDGEPLESLGSEAFEFMLRVVSGERTAGEKAGHSQVQLWREWRQHANGPKALGNEETSVSDPELTRDDDAALAQAAKTLMNTAPTEKVALVLPASLCSGQVALMIARKLNAASHNGFTRAVALPHTEGCGNSGGESERLFLRTMSGYLAHPLVSRALLLEHGCEKTHNDRFRNAIREAGLTETDFGFASVQLDGGIDRAITKVVHWFDTAPSAPSRISAPFAIGFAGEKIPGSVASAFRLVARYLEAAGGAAVFPANLFGAGDRLQYGERFLHAGLFTMDSPTDDLLEITTGLGATGVQAIVIFAPGNLLPGNPLVPTIQIASENGKTTEADIIASEKESPAQLAAEILETLRNIRSGAYIPRSQALENVAFQITRGMEGISL
jgi:altronate dehydratase